jgi:FkbM family methyltransferase
LDVEIFPRLHARLYPRSNRCEKIVLTGSWFFDAEELDAIHRQVDSVVPGDTFVFVDVGANVGLYGLYCYGAACARGISASIVAIEPDRTNRSRLLTNFAINNVTGAAVSSSAVSDKPGKGLLVGGEKNRGERRLVRSAAGNLDIETLFGVLDKLNLRRIDCMKVDVEGKDYDVLNGFLRDAPGELWPELEAGSRKAEKLLHDLLCESGRYRLEKRTRLNLIFTRSTAKENGAAI